MSPTAVTPDQFSTFGELLKYLRRQARITQRELAIAVGYSDTQISRIEQNQRVPDSATITALFVPALYIEQEPKWAARLLELAKAAEIEMHKGMAPVLPPFLEWQTESLEAEETIFVAREPELARLGEHLKLTLAGRGRVVFITGEAGSGKTALLKEFARRAHLAAEDLLVTSGYCNAQTGLGDPYLPFRHILRQLVCDIEMEPAGGVLHQAHLRRLWNSVAVAVRAVVEHGSNLMNTFVSGRTLHNHITALVPEKTNWLEKLDQLTTDQARDHGDRGQSDLHEQFVNVLQAIARQQPLLLLLDDLHWADAASISLLFHLGRRLYDSRILLVGAFRPDDVALGRDGERHPLEPVVNELKRQYGEIEVNLDQAQGQEFVEAWLDSQPNQLGAAFRATLYRHTQGQPLFTVELVRTMQEREEIVRDENGSWVEGPRLVWGQLPARTEAVIEERVARLAEPLREILITASVEGNVFTAQVVARVQGIPERNILQLLSRALEKRHRLIRKEAEAQVGQWLLTRYQFAHALFQQYLYNELSAGERRLLHREIATVLEDLYAGRTDEITVRLARHYTEAGEVVKAVEYLLRAGKQAAAQFANVEAAAYFSRALALTPETDAVGQYDLLLAREQIYDMQGLRSTQVQDLITLAELAEGQDDNQRKAEVALRWSGYSNAIGDYAAAIAVAQQAVAIAQASGLVGSEAAGRLEWGRALWRQGNYATARAQLEQALALAQAAQLPDVEADTLCSLSTATQEQGNYAEARTYAEKALRLFHEMGNRRGESNALNNVGDVALQQGDFATARAYFERALLLDREIGDRLGESLVLNNLGDVALQQGDYVAGRAYYEQALCLCRDIGYRRGENFTLADLGLLFHQLGDDETAYQYSQQALSIALDTGDRHEQGHALINSGHALLGMGRLDEAADSYRQASRLQQALNESTPLMESLAGLTRASLARGDMTQAKTSVEEILNRLEISGLYGMEEPFQVYLTCYRVLRASHDPRARAILNTAYTLLQERAAKLNNEDLRRSFLEDVPSHRDLAAEWMETERRLD